MPTAVPSRPRRGSSSGSTAARRCRPRRVRPRPVPRADRTRLSRRPGTTVRQPPLSSSVSRIVGESASRLDRLCMATKSEATYLPSSGSTDSNSTREMVCIASTTNSAPDAGTGVTASAHGSPRRPSRAETPRAGRPHRGRPRPGTLCANRRRFAPTIQAGRGREAASAHHRVTPCA